MGRAGGVSLPMYPLPWLRPATEALWDRIASELRIDTPLAPGTRLAPWDLDERSLWASPDLLLSQTCAWPLVHRLHGSVRPLGSFLYRLEGVDSYRYRSVVVRRRGAPGAAAPGPTAAVNGFDSLSGWISLRTTLEPARVVLTGSHVASIDAVCSGSADVASIDALTYAFVAGHDPAVVAGLDVVDRGPLVPTLPLITRGDADGAVVRELRRALSAAAATAEAAELLICGFEPLDDADYAEMLADLDLAGLGDSCEPEAAPS